MSYADIAGGVRHAHILETISHRGCRHHGCGWLQWDRFEHEIAWLGLDRTSRFRSRRQ
jgi:hypothetical protein